VPIFDQGYQHWSGHLSGHSWRWLAITRHGVKVGRQSRLLRIVLLAAWVPALALSFMLCVWGLLERKSDSVQSLMQVLRFFEPQVLADPRHYRVEVWTICYDIFLQIELYYSMVLILIVGPQLISKDLRFNALPLYFSRPLRRIDYFLGKLGVIAVFLGVVVIAPSVIAYGLGLLFSLDMSILRETFGLLISAVTYGLVIALSAGLLILALSSLSRNSRYVALFWLGIWFVSMSLGGLLHEVDQQQRRQRTYRRAAENQSALLSDQSAGTPEAQRKRQMARQESWDNVAVELEAQELRAAKADWRPMISYTANLQRVGQHLLGTQRAWESVSLLRPPEERTRFLLEHMDLQYPWHWSASVLIGLFGLSACILNYRVRSLDRLK
jgi:ABC-2 type transport system permease protein